MTGDCEREETFSERQFSRQPTHAQLTFDVLFGIIIPVGCLCFDPIVFRSSSLGFGQPILGDYLPGASVVIGLSLLSLITWLLLRRPASVLVGFLSGGALFALLLGIVLLPFSLMGLFIMFIGVLGFTPFVTAFVFLRNAVRAYQLAGKAKGADLVAFVCFLTACTAPVAAQSYVTYEISRSLELAGSSDAGEAQYAIATLKRFRPLSNFDAIAFAYEKEHDKERRERLATAYRELTGEDVDIRLATLRD